jgi:hypothetical protein
VIVLVAMMVAASATGAVLVMIMLVLMRMLMMAMVVMRMGVMRVGVMLMGMSMALTVAVGVAMAVTMMVMPMIVVAVMGAALRPEWALDRGCRAALPAHQLGHGRVVLHIEGVGRDLHQAMLTAEVPGEAREAQGVLGFYLQQELGRRLHLDEAAILQPQGVAVVDGGVHVEIEEDLGAALPLEPRLAAVARLVIESDRVDHTVGLYGGLADDGGDAGHGFVSVKGRVELR